MDGDEDRRVGRRVQRREEIDLVALVRTISKLQPWGGEGAAALAKNASQWATTAASILLA